MYTRHRNIVIRADGRPVNVVRPRGLLFVCSTGCCCGRTEDGFAPVPVETFHQEWERRRLRNVVHLTVGGCLGPCALANVVLLLFDGQAQWFHSMNSEALALALYDHIEQMLEQDRCLPTPPALAPYHFTASAWQPRPDGQPVEDRRLWRRRAHECRDEVASGISAAGQTLDIEQVVSVMQGAAALPRKNGELVFGEPWQGRVFGMAVALHEQGLYEWEDFRQALIAEIKAAEARGGPFAYYEIWLATFEQLLAKKRIVTPAELDETTYQVEFGERDATF